MDYKQYWFWLQNIPGIGRKKTVALLQHFQSPEEIYRATHKALGEVNGLGSRDIEQIISSREEKRIQKAYEKLENRGIHYIISLEKEFPSKLRYIYDAPLSLYYRGKLPDDSRKMVAVVGARDCSSYGREVAYNFSKTLAQAGIQVVSGLARGVDLNAHLGALCADGYTCGVLGCGIDICYPASNLDTFMQMVERGGIISEYGPGVQSRPGLFPERNRIISGLCEGVLVVEAREKSGSLITAELALEQGRDIFVIPGRVDDELSAGCNQLIKQGAILITSPQDILDYYEIDYSDRIGRMKKNNSLLEKEETMVYASLSFLPMHIDEIAKKCGLSVVDVINTLMELEQAGLIRQEVPCYFSRKSKELC